MFPELRRWLLISSFKVLWRNTFTWVLSSCSIYLFSLLHQFWLYLGLSTFIIFAFSFSLFLTLKTSKIVFTPAWVFLFSAKCVSLPSAELTVHFTFSTLFGGFVQVQSFGHFQQQVWKSTKQQRWAKEFEWHSNGRKQASKLAWTLPLICH